MYASVDVYMCLYAYVRELVVKNVRKCLCVCRYTPGLMAVREFSRAQTDTADGRKVTESRGPSLRLATPRLRARLERDLDSMALTPGALQVNGHWTSKFSLPVSLLIGRIKLDSKVGERLCRGFGKIPGIDAKLQHHRTIHTGGAPVTGVPGCTH